MGDSNCLNQEQLRRFNDGTLGLVDAERAAEHLDYCQACVDNLTAMGSDCLLAGAIGKGDRQFAFQHEAEFELLQQRLDALNSSVTFGDRISYQAAVDSALTDLQDLREYRIIREIGRGGMGVVLKARHRRMQRNVAIKLLPKSISQDDEQQSPFEVFPSSHSSPTSSVPSPHSVNGGSSTRRIR